MQNTKEMNTVETKLYKLMKNGNWYRSSTIHNRCKDTCTPDSALRRLRDMRKKSFVKSIETQRPNKPGQEWKYRMLVK